MYLVTFTIVVEAETEDEAIEKATEGKGGGHWEAQFIPLDHDAVSPQ
jgi:hypothetical protein